MADGNDPDEDLPPEAEIEHRSATDEEREEEEIVVDITPSDESSDLNDEPETFTEEFHRGTITDEQYVQRLAITAGLDPDADVEVVANEYDMTPNEIYQQAEQSRGLREDIPDKQ